MSIDSSLRTGKYVGDGALSRRIVTNGIVPKIVFVKADTEDQLWLRSDQMTGSDITKPYAYEFTPDLITGLFSGYFTVGISANQAGVTYYWAVLSGEAITTFSYTGDGMDDHAITGAGFAPVAAFVWRNTTGGPGPALLWRANGMPTNTSVDWLGIYTDGIKSLDSDGLTLGTNSLANENAIDYFGFFVEDTGFNNLLAYTGDGTNDRDIHGLVFKPAFVFLEGLDNTYPNMRFKAEPDNLSMGIDFYEEASIKLFLADGIRVSGYNSVNVMDGAFFALCFALQDILHAALGSFEFTSGVDNIVPGSDTGWNRALSLQQTRPLGSNFDNILRIANGSMVRTFTLMTTPARFLLLQALLGTVQIFTDWFGDSRRVYVKTVELQSGSRAFRSIINIELVEQ